MRLFVASEVSLNQNHLRPFVALLSLHTEVTSWMCIVLPQHLKALKLLPNLSLAFTIRPSLRGVHFASIPPPIPHCRQTKVMARCAPRFRNAILHQDSVELGALWRSVAYAHTCFALSTVRAIESTFSRRMKHDGVLVR